MTVNDILVVFTLLVTIITVLAGVLAYWEFSQLKTLRQELKRFQSDLRQQLFRAQKAQQRIIASYGMTDPAQKIALLKSAIDADPDSFNDVVKALEGKGYTFVSAEIEMVPQNYITMTSEDDVRSMTKLLDMLEDNEDVQNVWHNWQQD